jgi:hypothetical protein
LKTFWQIQEDKQKCIDIENACQLLSLVLGSQFGLQVDKFTEFLKVNFVPFMHDIEMWQAAYHLFGIKGFVVVVNVQDHNMEIVLVLG